MEPLQTQLNQSNKTVGIIGAGAWGTALGQMLSGDGREILMYERNEKAVQDINEKGENTVYIPSIKLNESLKATNKLSDMADRDILLLVTPAQHMRSTLEELKEYITKKTILVICSKGIELKTGMLLSQVAKQVTPDNPIAVLSGPSFSSEIARGLPCAVTIATPSKQLGAELQDALGVKKFRPYVAQDIVGAQLGGAIKNVIAIACGIVMGKELGESARAALLTRGIAEIVRLAIAMDGKKSTLLGMCGVGDLVLTCSSMQSRNYSLGMALGQGKTLEEILGSRNAITEGVYTAKATLELAKKHAVDMPITEAVNKTLNENMPIDDAIQEMLNRPFRYEMKKK